MKVLYVTKTRVIHVKTKKTVYMRTDILWGMNPSAAARVAKNKMNRDIINLQSPFAKSESYEVVSKAINELGPLLSQNVIMP